MRRSSKPTFHIAIVNHADRSNPEHWAPKVSIRRSRAIKQCKKLRMEGNRFAMLFIEQDGTRMPIGLKMPESQEAGRIGHNSATLGSYVSDEVVDALRKRTKEGLTHAIS